MNDKDMIKWLKEALDLKDKLLDAFREENEQLKLYKDKVESLNTEYNDAITDVIKLIENAGG